MPGILMQPPQRRSVLPSNLQGVLHAANHCLTRNCGVEAEALESLSKKELLSMLKFGADRIFANAEGKPPTDAELDALIDRSAKVAATAGERRRGLTGLASVTFRVWVGSGRTPSWTPSSFSALIAAVAARSRCTRLPPNALKDKAPYEELIERCL